MKQVIQRSGSVSYRRSSSSRVIHPFPMDDDVMPVYIPPSNRRIPLIAPLIFAANVIVFIVTMFVNDCPENSDKCIGKFLGRLSFQQVRENPLIGPSSNTLERMGGLVIGKLSNQAWRLVICIWLHAGVVHVTSDMFSFLFYGIRIEPTFGFVKTILLYIISGVGGSLLSALFMESMTSVGASRAVLGLF